MAIRQVSPAAHRLGFLSDYGLCPRNLTSWGGSFPKTAAGRKKALEGLWREFFSDPSQWWDHRSEKIHARYPDFKHKITREALWLNGYLKPPWVDAELAALPPGSVQENSFSWNARLARYTKAGQPEKAMQLYQQMQRQGVNADRFSVVSLLNACASLRSLEKGKSIHSQIIDRGLENDTFVGNSLIHMYAKCGSIEDAWRVFNHMPKRDVISWSSVIQGFVKCGQGQNALWLFRQMRRMEVEPDPFTFVGVINACATEGALEEGRRVHAQIIRHGCDTNAFVGSSLVDMYAKCGSIDEAWRVFSRMPNSDLASWNTMIRGYVKCGQAQRALELFGQMQRQGVEPDNVTFVGMVNACASVGALEEGRRIHEQINQSGCVADLFVASSLVDMYSKCGSIDDALRVFEKMHTRDVVCWNAMLLGCVKCGQGQKALELFQQLEHESVMPDRVTFVGMLNACASIGALEEGRHIHELINERGCEADRFVGSSLINMYAKCGSIDDAWRVFKKFPTRDVVNWNAMILGLVKCGQGLKALELYGHMQEQGLVGVAATFVGVVNACASVGALEEGRLVHEQIIQSGHESDVFVCSSLVDMYAKCGRIEDAWRVFNMMSKRDVIAWNAMILAHVKCGQGQKALELSREMQQEGVEPGPVTFVGMLNACASVRELEEGRSVHDQIVQMGFESDVFVASSLVDMYAKCGSIEESWRVFREIPTRDVVCWNAMIMGLVSCGRGQEAVELYREMQEARMEPVPVTFLAILKACASVGALGEGRRIHEQIVQSGCESNIFVASSLVDMYAKCGSIDDALRVFNRMPTHDKVAWNAVILGHGKCGQMERVLELYKQMHQEGTEPESDIFAEVLNACATVGTLEEGRCVHNNILQSGCASDIFVCSRLVDMYVKCGSLDDAWRVFNSMPTHNLLSWNALLRGLVKSGQEQKALELFGQMQEEDVEADAGTFIELLDACVGLKAVEEGRRLHELIIQSGWEFDLFVAPSLVAMYAKCGSIKDARCFFDEIPSLNLACWNAMLGGYALHGLAKEAHQHFEKMCKEGVEVNKETFSHLLSSCNSAGLVDEALQYLKSMTSVYNVSPTVEHWASIFDLLGCSGRLQEAEDVIKQTACEANAAIWMSLLSACRLHGIVEVVGVVSKRVSESETGKPEIRGCS